MFATAAPSPAAKALIPLRPLAEQYPTIRSAIKALADSLEQPAVSESVQEVIVRRYHDLRDTILDTVKIVSGPALRIVADGVAALAHVRFAVEQHLAQSVGGDAAMKLLAPRI